MAKIDTFDLDFLENDEYKEYITDWYSLASQIGVKTCHLSYLEKNKAHCVTRYNIKGRTVYGSKGALKEVQGRLIPLFLAIQESILTDHLLSYKPNFDFIPVIKSKANNKMLIHFDIRKYFDSITASHIVDTLMFFGYSKQGAIQISKNCTVRRGNIETLQQGSPCSPVLSNLVGYYLMDRFLLDWVKEYQRTHNIELEYVRYCDNVVLFVNNGTGLEEVKTAYKNKVHSILSVAKLRSHMWAAVKHNHPFKHMRFLNIVLNKIARIERPQFDNLRAILFNVICKDHSEEIRRYFEEPEETFNYRVCKERFISKIQGKLVYYERINKKQGKALRKLFEVINKNEFDLTNFKDSQKFSLLKKYKDNTQSVDSYITELFA